MHHWWLTGRHFCVLTHWGKRKNEKLTFFSSVEFESVEAGKTEKTKVLVCRKKKKSIFSRLLRTKLQTFMVIFIFVLYLARFCCVYYSQHVFWQFSSNWCKNILFTAFTCRAAPPSTAVPAPAVQMFSSVTWMNPHPARLPDRTGSPVLTLNWSASAVVSLDTGPHSHSNV